MKSARNTGIVVATLAVALGLAACSKDQEHLSAALEKALSQQQEFEKRYRDQLLSVSADLISSAPNHANRSRIAADWPKPETPAVGSEAPPRGAPGE